MSPKKLIVLAAVFAALALPVTYRLTRGVFGGWVASASGCATQGGVLLHAVVFAAAIALLMLWKKRSEGFDEPIERPNLLRRFTARRSLVMRHHPVTITDTFKGDKIDPVLYRVIRRWFKQRGLPTNNDIEITDVTEITDGRRSPVPLGGFWFFVARIEGLISGDALLFWDSPNSRYVPVAFFRGVPRMVPLS